MAEHTPGQWEKSQNLIFDSKGELVATVSRKQDGYVQANARLIAAAPEFLEKLKQVTAICANWNYLLRNRDDELNRTIRENCNLWANECRDLINEVVQDVS